MITNSIVAFPLQTLANHLGQMVAGQCFSIVLDGTTTVRRGIVVNSDPTSEANLRCWLEGASQTGRGIAKVDLFHPNHGITSNLWPRAQVQRMNDNSFAAFARLIPRSVKSCLPTKTASISSGQKLPQPVVSSPFQPSLTNEDQPTSIVQRYEGKVVRVKREQAPCSPPSSLDDRPKKRRYSKKSGHIDCVQTAHELRAAIDILEEKINHITTIVDAAVEKIADLSLKVLKIEGKIIQQHK